jgi:hypothetical protein
VITFTFNFIVYHYAYHCYSINAYSQGKAFNNDNSLGKAEVFTMAPVMVFVMSLFYTSEIKR